MTCPAAMDIGNLSSLVGSVIPALSCHNSLLTRSAAVTADDEAKLEESLFERSEGFDSRRPKQIEVPSYPTTTIGSFPQTIGIARL